MIFDLLFYCGFYALAWYMGHSWASSSRASAEIDAYRRGELDGFTRALSRVRFGDLERDPALAGRCIHGTPKDDDCPPCRAGFR